MTKMITDDWSQQFQAKHIVGRGRIKLGASLTHDHRCGYWPNCIPPYSEYKGEEYQYQAKDPNMVFSVEWNGRFWKCKADGYGHIKSRGDIGEYGNGSILVSGFNNVEILP